MTQNVYTTRLFDSGNALAAGHTLSAPVPVGFVWDVRCVVANLAQFWWFYAQGLRISKHAGANICCWDRPDVYARKQYTWEGRVLLQAGEQIDVFALDNLWNVVITGYQLTLP